MEWLLLVVFAVPDFPHEVHVELFRNRAELARELLRASGELTSLASEELEAQCVSNEVAQLKPVQHRADSVILFRDKCGAARLAIIVEVQHDVDENKSLTWPLYVAAIRERHKCPTYLLVFALKPKTAEWAKASIDLGHPGFQLRPLVITHKDVPKMNLNDVADSPELAVLRAVAYRTVASAKAAVKAIDSMPKGRNGSYIDAILWALPAPNRKYLEEDMQGQYQYRSKFLRNIVEKGRRDGRKQGFEKGQVKGFEKGREEGLEKGREEGLEKGLEEGLAKGKQEAALAMAREKLGEVSESEAAAICAVREESALTSLIVGLARARTPKDARSAISRAKARQRKAPASGASLVAAAASS